MNSDPADPIQAALVAPALAVRVGLRALLSSGPPFRERSVEIVWEATSLEGPEPLPDGIDVLVITEDGLPGDRLGNVLSGWEGQLSVLLLADDARAARVVKDLPLRAWGVLSLDATPEELAAAVYALHQGLIVGSRSLVAPLFDRTYTSTREGGDAFSGQLTEREGQVLQLLAQGLPNKQIALALNISEHTIKFHISSIYGKLGATNRTEAVRFGVQRGLVLL